MLYTYVLHIRRNTHIDPVFSFFRYQFPPRTWDSTCVYLGILPCTIFPGTLRSSTRQTLGHIYIYISITFIGPRVYTRTSLPKTKHKNKKVLTLVTYDKCNPIRIIPAYLCMYVCTLNRESNQSNVYVLVTVLAR